MLLPPVKVWNRPGETALAGMSPAQGSAGLTWIFTMGDTIGPQLCDGFIGRASLVSGIPFSADDMNSWPPYHIQEDGVMIVNMLEDDPRIVEETGTSYKIGVENPMYALACALHNRGYDVFPNTVRIVANFGQVFEDMIVTCRVSDGVIIDREVFPVSVVNYPTDNNPPIINTVKITHIHVDES